MPVPRHPPPRRMGVVWWATGLSVVGVVAGWGMAAALWGNAPSVPPRSTVLPVVSDALAQAPARDEPPVPSPAPPPAAAPAPVPVSPPAAPARATPPPAAAPGTGRRPARPARPRPIRAAGAPGTATAPIPADPPSALPPLPAAGEPAPLPPPPAPIAPAQVSAYVPPPTARIPAADLPDVAQARATLAARAAGARGDLGTCLEWLRALDARHGNDPQEGRRATIERTLRANAWWFATRGAPQQRVILRDPDGVILTFREGHGFMVNPVATTGRWRNLNDDLSAPALADVLATVAVARPGGGAAWEYYDVADDPAAVQPGVSGMAQARIADLMANAYRQTGQERYVVMARRALLVLDTPVDEGGARSIVSRDGKPAGPWFVERAHPGDDPWKGAALNGFMVSLLSLSSTRARAAEPVAAAAVAASTTPAATATAAAPPPVPPVAAETAALAERLATDGRRTLATYLPEHDTGAWSLYGLLTPGKPPGTYLADLNYHCYHVHLLRALARVDADGPYGATADRWQGYVDARGVTCPER